MSFDINIYGCGNMTQAIFYGLKGSPLDFQVHTFTPSFTRAQNMALELKGKAYRSIHELPPSKYYFLGCKPQQFEELSRDIKDVISNDSVVISIMAGVTLSRLKSLLGVQRIIRVMPSTPSIVGKGISLVYASSEVDHRALEEVKNLFKGVSKVITVDTEDHFDRLMSVSACGPAYIFEIGRIFSDYLESHGINKGTADLVASELFLGSATLMQHSHESFETLRNNVMSKGGATEQAIFSLNDSKLSEILSTACDKAYLRAKELNQ